MAVVLSPTAVDSTVAAATTGSGVAITTATTVSGTNAMVEAKTQDGIRLAHHNESEANAIREQAQIDIAKLQEAVDRKVSFFQSFMMAARFFPIIVLVLIVLAFFGKPLEFIILFITGIISTILYICTFLLGFKNATIWIPFIIYNFAVYFIPALIYSAVIFIVFIIMSAFIGLLWLFNGCTGGFKKGGKGLIQDWILCQVSPEAWFKNPSFHLNNVHSRSFFCAKPCLDGYTPDGTNCKKMYKYQSSYCAPAEIMRIFTGYSRNDKPPYFINYNTNDLRYLSKTPHDRENILKNHYLKKIKFMNTCNVDSMTKYIGMTRNMCSSIDSMQKTGTLSPQQALLFRTVCKQQFCSPLGYQSPFNYPFCAGLGNSTSMDASQLVKQICKICSILIVFFLVMIMSFKFIFTKDEKMFS